MRSSQLPIYLYFTSSPLHATRHTPTPHAPRYAEQTMAATPNVLHGPYHPHYGLLSALLHYLRWYLPVGLKSSEIHLPTSAIFWRRYLYCFAVSLGRPLLTHDPNTTYHPFCAINSVIIVASASRDTSRIISPWCRHCRPLIHWGSTIEQAGSYNLKTIAPFTKTIKDNMAINAGLTDTTTNRKCNEVYWFNLSRHLSSCPSSNAYQNKNHVVGRWD